MKPTETEVKAVKDMILDPETTTYNGRELPTPQRTGTQYQIDTYAERQAREFLNN